MSMLLPSQLPGAAIKEAPTVMPRAGTPQGEVQGDNAQGGVGQVGLGLGNVEQDFADVLLQLSNPKSASSGLQNDIAPTVETSRLAAFRLERGTVPFKPAPIPTAIDSKGLPSALKAEEPVQAGHPAKPGLASLPHLARLPQILPGAELSQTIQKSHPDPGAQPSAWSALASPQKRPKTAGEQLTGQSPEQGADTANAAQLGPISPAAAQPAAGHVVAHSGQQQVEREGADNLTPARTPPIAEHRLAAAGSDAPHPPGHEATPAEPVRVLEVTAHSETHLPPVHGPGHSSADCRRDCRPGGCCRGCGRSACTAGRSTCASDADPQAPVAARSTRTGRHSPASVWRQASARSCDRQSRNARFGRRSAPDARRGLEGGRLCRRRTHDPVGRRCRNRRLVFALARSRRAIPAARAKPGFRQSVQRVGRRCTRVFPE